MEINNKQAIIETEKPEIAIPNAVKTIRDLGYDVATTTQIIPVLQMTCASCAVSVESIIKFLPGVVNASVNYASAEVKVEYISSLVTLNQMRVAVQSIGYDLFINQAATKKNTAILYTPESFTFSEPKTTFSSWIYQKRRHATTSNFYKGFDKFQLGLFFFSQFWFLVLAIILLAFQFQWMIVTGIIVFRYLFTWISLACAAGKLKEKDVMYWYPIIEIVLIFTQLSVFFRNLISKPVHWK